MLRTPQGLVDLFLDTLLGALAKRQDVNNLTGVSNNAGAGDSGLGTAFSITPYLVLTLNVHQGSF